MSSSEETTISETIVEAATENVQTVTVDGNSVSTHSIRALIDADKHVRRNAASNNPFSALRRAKLRPGSPSGNDCNP